MVIYLYGVFGFHIDPRRFDSQINEEVVNLNFFAIWVDKQQYVVPDVF